MFENVKKLLEYDWNKIIENTVPENEEVKMRKSEYDAIMMGCILQFGAFVLRLIFSLGVVFFLTKRVLSPFFNTQAVGLKSQIGIGQFSSIALFIGLFLYVHLMKEKKQKSIGYFIVSWILLVDTIKSLVGVITLVASCFLHPILGIIGFLSTLLALLGNVNILVGCIDFCMHCKKDKQEHAEEKQTIKTKPIDVNDVSFHESPVCFNCQHKVRKEDAFCPNCGTKLTQKK